jgi:hypothetical protein
LEHAGDISQEIEHAGGHPDERPKRLQPALAAHLRGPLRDDTVRDRVDSSLNLLAGCVLLLLDLGL